jgi:opacity protein-like surface antigen
MTMKLPLIALAALGLTAATAAAATVASNQAAPAAATVNHVGAAAAANSFFAGADVDDDRDNRRRYGPMPQLDESVLRRAGLVRVREIDRDDGRIEVEGYDAQGREIEMDLDLTGRRILHIDRDDDRDDDRWDD